MMRLLLLATFVIHVVALDTSCHPGGNFDLSKWNLQLPSGTTGHPDTITPSGLQGCGGYSSGYFFTDGNTGQLVMTVPGSPSSSGCVTTPNSLHCRTEFREINPSSWDPASGQNRLKVTMSVPDPDNSGHGTVIGQIHIDDSISSKPVCELFYNSAGLISIGVERTRAGGDLVFTPLTTVHVGQTFTYEIRYEALQLSVAINNDAFVNLDQFELSNPRSYFKVGNYNQGDSYSEVHIQSISVSHSSSAPSTGSAHPVSTIVKGGIGPYETIYVLDHIIVPPPPFPSPTGACAAAPTKYSDGTVNLQLYYEDNCCHVVETAHIGNFNVCHNANGPFSSIEQAVGADLFDRGIHVVGYEDLDCNGGTSDSLSLSNSKGCQAITIGNAGYHSFLVTEPPTCAVTGPGIQSDSTVTLELYSDFGCCTSFETIKLGTTGSCHDANQGFHSFSQSVGKNEFDWNIHIHTYTESGCQGNLDSFSLTNAATCNKHGTAWKSFQIRRECQKVIPDIKNDNTVSMTFYRDGGCCVPTKEDITLGQLGSCHNAGKRFGSLTQAVGSNMFDRGIHIEAFTGTDCTGTKVKFDFTNAEPHCSATGKDEAYTSFRIVGPPPPVCEWRKAPNSNANTVTIELYNDFGCCDFNKEVTVGVVDTCHNTPNGPSGGVLGLGVAAGSSWTNGAQLEVYTGNDCTGAARFAGLTSDLANLCLVSGLGSINSFKLIRPSAPPTATVPTAQPPPPTQTTTEAPKPPHPSVCPNDWIAVGYSQECGITTGCGGNFGAIYFNACNNLHLGADGSWCGGQWVSGWNVQCDSGGAPTVVNTPNGNFGNCFYLPRNCEISIGIASEYNFQYYCCSPL